MQAIAKAKAQIEEKEIIVLAIYCGLRVFLKAICGDSALIEFGCREFVVDLCDVFPIPHTQISY